MKVVTFSKLGRIDYPMSDRQISDLLSKRSEMTVSFEPARAILEILKFNVHNVKGSYRLLASTDFGQSPCLLGATLFLHRHDAGIGHRNHDVRTQPMLRRV